MHTTRIVITSALFASACIGSASDNDEIARSAPIDARGSGAVDAGSDRDLPPYDETPVTVLRSLPSGSTQIEVPGQATRVVPTSTLASEPVAAEQFVSTRCMSSTGGRTSPAVVGSNGLIPVVPALPPTWRGHDVGGCGVFATYQCDVRLGRRSSSSYTESQWDEIADGIGMDADGQNTIDGMNAYYTQHGDCAEHQKGASLLLACKRFRAGSDVKFHLKFKDGDTWKGHFVTVIGCDRYGAIVNDDGTPRRVATKFGKPTIDGLQNGAGQPIQNEIDATLIYNPCPGQ